jgi:hypothetical protein
MINPALRSRQGWAGQGAREVRHVTRQRRWSAPGRNWPTSAADGQTKADPPSARSPASMGQPRADPLGPRFRSLRRNAWLALPGDPE